MNDLSSINVNEMNSPDSIVTEGLPSTLQPKNVSANSETSWWVPLATSITQVWPEISSDRQICFPINRSIWKTIPDAGEEVRGLIYVKSYKASSSTAEGVNIALAYHLAPSSESKCEHYNRHEFANAKLHALRNRAASLLWTLVRFPRDRDLSQLLHFRVSRQGMDLQSPAAVVALRYQKSSQTQYLGLMRIPPETTTQSDLVQFIQTNILQAYDFIGVTERMPESLAVMSLLWHIQPSHLVVLSAKQSQRGDYDAGSQRKKCTKLTPRPTPLPSTIAQYLDSPSYTENNWDFVLYHAVNASLDRTIEKLGRDRVQTQTALIQHLQQLAERECRPKAVYPCSQEGEYQPQISNCYIQDAGCGYECVDDIMRKYSHS